MLHDAAELRKRYSSERIVAECANFQKLGDDIARLWKLTAKIIGMSKTLNEGETADAVSG